MHDLNNNAITSLAVPKTKRNVKSSLEKSISDLDLHEQLIMQQNQQSDILIHEIRSMHKIANEFNQNVSFLSSIIKIMWLINTQAKYFLENSLLQMLEMTVSHCHSFSA